MKLTIRLFTTIVIIALLSSYCNKVLRGKFLKSDDNATYLIIEEGIGADNKIFFNGKEQPFKVWKMGGFSTLICGRELSFEIKTGTVFHFHYWDP